MPWPAIPWKDGRVKKLSKHFKIKGLPRLIVFDAKTHRVLADDAVDALTAQGPVLIDHWMSQV